MYLSTRAAQAQVNQSSLVRTCPSDLPCLALAQDQPQPRILSSQLSCKMCKTVTGSKWTRFMIEGAVEKSPGITLNSTVNSRGQGITLNSKGSIENQSQ